MKNRIITALVVLGAAAAAFGAFYAANAEPAGVRTAARTGDSSAWLRSEFRLDDAQTEAIERLQAGFERVCAGHCAAIRAARRRGAPPSEISGLEEECVASMKEHFRQVAAIMPPGQGDRYLALVLPRIADYDHRGAPNLQGRP
jgi:hypothetical protein